MFINYEICLYLNIKDGLIFHLGFITRKWERIRRSFRRITSIIAYCIIQRVGALGARKYMRALACACTDGRWVDMPPASRNSLDVMCFQLSFRGRVREARRLARATGLASINRGALFLILVPRGPPRRLEIYRRWFVRTKYRLSVRCEDNVRDNAYSRRAANSSAERIVLELRREISRERRNNRGKLLREDIRAFRRKKNREYIQNLRPNFI